LSEFELGSRTVGGGMSQEMSQLELIEPEGCYSPEGLALVFVLPNPPAVWLLLWPKPENPPNVDMMGPRRAKSEVSKNNSRRVQATSR
jgi:hypothetical protein